MDRTEYLEKRFSDAFKREADQDENVARSLPFVAAALTLLVTVLNLAGQHLPPMDSSTYSISVHILVLAAAMCVAGVLWQVFAAIRAQKYRYPPREPALVAWSDGLEGFHRTAGLTGAALQMAVVTDLRSHMVEQFALANVHNRAINARKLYARAQALVLLMAALAFVLLAAATIFLVDRLEAPSTPKSAPHAASQAQVSIRVGSAAHAGQTRAAPTPVHH